MGAGKLLCILGGIVTLVSTFVLSVFSTDIAADLPWVAAGDAYGSGLGLFLHIADIFGDIDGVATELGVESYLVYIFIVLLIFWAISGIIQLIGVKSRAAAIIGSIMPLFLSVIILLTYFMTLPDFFGFINLLSDGTQIGGFLPYNLDLLDSVALGTFTLLGGGVLGLLGGILGPSEY